MLHPDVYAGVSRTGNAEEGGQSLILHEIVSLFVQARVRSVWLPFHATMVLAQALQSHAIRVVQDPFGDNWWSIPHDCEGLYFGTPTIVAGSVLFPRSVKIHPDTPKHWIWTAEREREVVRGLCPAFLNVSNNPLMIVSGVGSGDVSVGHRIEDMKELCLHSRKTFSYPKVVCMKLFNTFTDYVVASERTEP